MAFRRKAPLVAVVILVALIGSTALIGWWWPADRAVSGSPENRDGAGRTEDASSLLPLPGSVELLDLGFEENTDREHAAQAAPVEVEGNTRFQRRLSAGNEFRRLAELLDAALRRATGDDGARRGDDGPPLDDLPEATIARLESDIDGISKGLPIRHLLYLDVHSLAKIDWPAREREGDRRLASIRSSRLFIRSLAQLGVDLTALRLTTPSPGGDPLGRDCLVRVWGRSRHMDDDRLPAGEIRTAERFVRHLFEATGFVVEVGFDVLATPELGREVFPFHIARPVWGRYFRKDALATLRSTLEPRARLLTLKHELVHAFYHRSAPDLTDPRFVGEGLASYLKHLRPGDDGLRVPLERLADDLARLRALLGRLRRTADFDAVYPAQLLRASPRDFYRMNPFSYLIAQAALAYIAPEAIAAAFEERSPLPIMVQVEQIDAAEFLRFIEENGARGNPARARVPLEGEHMTDGSRREARPLETILADIGIVVRPGQTLAPDVFEIEPDVDDPEAVDTVLELLGAAETPVLILTDLSAGMREPLHRKASRLGFVKGFFERLDAVDGKPVAIARLAEKVAPVDLDALDSPGAEVGYTAVGALRDWRSRRGEHPNVVLCVGSVDLDARRAAARSGQPPVAVSTAELALWYTAYCRRASFRPRVTLVIDLAAGSSDALALARGIAGGLGYRGLIAYWNPTATTGGNDR